MYIKFIFVLSITTCIGLLSCVSATLPAALTGLLKVASPNNGCPLCDSSVYSYCSHKMFHDACCCSGGTGHGIGVGGAGGVGYPAQLGIGGPIGGGYGPGIGGGGGYVPGGGFGGSGGYIGGPGNFAGQGGFGNPGGFVGGPGGFAGGPGGFGIPGASSGYTQCQGTNCGYLHANSCYEYSLIVNCCCNNPYK